MTTASEGLYSMVIRASQERVWKEITAIGRKQPFYWDAVLDAELVKGKPLHYRSEDGTRTYIVGEVLEVQPFSRLVHTFRFHDLDEPPQKVTYQLDAISEGTRLTVTHEGLAQALREALINSLGSLAVCRVRRQGALCRQWPSPLSKSATPPAGTPRGPFGRV